MIRTNEMNGNKGTQASTERFGKAHTFHVLFSSRPFLFFTLRATHRIRCMRIRVCARRANQWAESHTRVIHALWHQRFSLLARGRGGLNGEFGRILVCLSPDLPYK